MKPAVLALFVLYPLPLCAQQACDTTVYPLSTPESRFEDHGDGTVTDTRSKLMWMRCSAGQQWSGGGCAGDPVDQTWASAQAEADAVNQRGSLFYKDWRVPQIRELASIAERQCENPRINLALFPNTPTGFYWTASTRPLPAAGEAAFALSFGAEGIRYEGKSEAHHVRLVRNAP